ncbi:MAG: WecB/TagA/CpsF family glycosyltransferase [Proteobacteria bacterium]|nr:WecB/TagA/CpsF family glycosyltransferase [Pseudomonadota bacterium]
MSTARAWSLLGYRISASSADELADDCLATRPAGAPLTVACANVHSLVTAATDRAFHEALRGAGRVTADGAPLRVAGRLLGESIGPRVTGWDLYVSTMARLDRRHGTAYFLGSTPAVLARIESRAARDYPNVRVLSRSPPFGEWSAGDETEIVAQINAVRPDIVWVGMSAPRQEKWAARCAARLDTNAVAGIGAVFDFYAGTVPRAPHLMRRAGLEWLYRLWREPRRLWRRYFVSGPRFVALVLSDWRARRRGHRPLSA